MRSYWIIYIMVLSLLLSLPVGSEAGPFTFTKIADTTTLMPSRLEMFQNFIAEETTGPAISRGNVMFYGDNSPISIGTPSHQGLYIGSIGGQLRALVDSNTPVPGGLGQGNFSKFLDDGKLDGQNITFRASDALNQVGIYTIFNGNLGTVSSIAVPNPQVPDS